MKRDERKIALRCAVYTRVSTYFGLEQTCPTRPRGARLRSTLPGP